MNPWDQLPDESDTAYSHFLIFRNLGPMRNVSAAYRVATGDKSKLAPGNWLRESDAHDWRGRAAKWDIAMLRDVLPEFAVRTLHSINKLAERTLEALESDQIRPQDFDEVVKAVQILASYIGPETISAIYANASNEGNTKAINAPASNTADAGALPPGDDQPPAIVDASARPTDSGISDACV